MSIDRRLLDHLAQVHDHHLVGHLGDHAQVVGDEHDRHAQVALQLLHQLQDLRLGGHIQGGGRLVGDQQAGLAGSAMAIMARWRMPPLSWKG